MYCSKKQNISRVLGESPSRGWWIGTKSLCTLHKKCQQKKTYSNISEENFLLTLFQFYVAFYFKFQIKSWAVHGIPVFTHIPNQCIYTSTLVQYTKWPSSTGRYNCFSLLNLFHISEGVRVSVLHKKIFLLTYFH